MLRLLRKCVDSVTGLCRLGRRLESLLGRIIELTHEERGAPSGLPWSKRLWALRNGFYSSRLVHYRLTRENLAEYLPDRQYRALHPINGDFSRLIDDKLQLPFTLKDFPDFVPKAYYLAHDGLLFGLAEGLPNCQRCQPGPLLDLLRQNRRFVVKPLYGSRGKGVRVLEHAGGTWRLDGRLCQEPDVAQALRDLRTHLIGEYVEQHAYAKHLFRHATNTMRLVTLRDDDTLQPLLVTAFHRVGTSRSQPVDNVGAGGLFGPISVTTGELGRFTGYPRGRSLEWFTHHPETGEPLAGVVIPRWHDLKDRILGVSRKLSFLSWMGYDVVATENGLKILEINSLPALSCQLFRPYLLQPEVAKFFQRRIRNLRRPSRQFA